MWSNGSLKQKACVVSIVFHMDMYYYNAVVGNAVGKRGPSLFMGLTEKLGQPEMIYLFVYLFI